MDLALVPLDDLLKEIESRCVCFIAAYETPKEENKDSMFYYGKGNWYQAVRLASVLNNDVLNNWNHELKFLQKLKRDKEEYG